ncbi:MAG TPA: pyruvate ferredoxin oxidoreductase [Gammaproteobacteria bacterium]|jgi:2-oxoglutarate ferredoxin oxidoreductase subunit gamma|nr:2-oxoacid:acceptor oxidoreductase family protein [Arenicellales bacterium]MDP6552637.1 2-oxoacid:acceptor oxidoreductase family protein [Arenicellales bacterium]MDP6791183.1 2-oxoacid:acceptor oxidoreductase family protein [Arenicellales bacterium]MDP6917800.1 2-oxoacid:acceptor oxidoreductase family protein [Arenicellales bacterium]HCX86514.1 pyruvate ferredoxin oxidoreductase [Gammaproteobacteria bacterium]|tara:strand:+ start:2350 stop:2913 length:564 start_codon:yes stop_codon:yes gene_type:complete
MNSEHRELRLSGSGGQGLLLAGRILAEALVREGHQVAWSTGYEPTSRGGLARADLVVSTGTVDYPLVTALDLAVILDVVAAASATGLLAPDALVLIDEQIEEQPQDRCRILPLSLVQTARSVGSLRATNIVALGALNAVAGMVAMDTLEAVIRQRVPAKFQQLNLDAFSAGVALAVQPSKPVAAISA